MANLRKCIITYVHKMQSHEMCDHETIQKLKNLTSKKFLKDWHLLINKKTMSADEIGVGFWAFLYDEELMRIVFKILNTLFKPRLLQLSFVKEHRVEGCIVMSSFNHAEFLKTLQEHKHIQSSLQARVGFDVQSIACCKNARDIIETLITNCLNLFKISAGCCTFDKYMDSAMITCLDRVQCGAIWHGSLHAARNKDLLALHQLKLQMLHEQASAQLLLGMDLNITNFAMMQESQRTLHDEVLALRQENEVLLTKLSKNAIQINRLQTRWLRFIQNLQTTVEALRHLQLISRFAWNQIMNIMHVNGEMQHNRDMID